MEKIEEEKPKKRFPKTHGRIKKDAYEKMIQDIIDLVRESGKPIDYYEISDKMNLPKNNTPTRDGKYQRQPDRAKRYAREIVRRFPDEFELVRKLQKNSVGGVYEKPFLKTKDVKI